MRARLCALVLSLAVSAAVSAQSTVTVGATASRSCYLDAESGSVRVNALEHCDTAVNSTATISERRVSLVNRAVVHLNMNRPEAALDDLARAESMGFDGPELHNNRASAYIQLNRFNDAVEAATMALDQGLARPEQAYFNRAVARERLNDLRGAYQDYTAAADAAPGWIMPRMELERFILSSG